MQYTCSISCFPYSLPYSMQEITHCCTLCNTTQILPCILSKSPNTDISTGENTPKFIILILIVVSCKHVR